MITTSLTKRDLNRLNSLKNHQNGHTLQRTGIFKTLHEDLGIGKATEAKLILSRTDINRIRELYLQHSNIDVFEDIDLTTRTKATQHFQNEKLSSHQVKSTFLSVYPLAQEAFKLNEQPIVVPKGAFFSIPLDHIGSVQTSTFILVENFETFIDLKRANFDFDAFPADTLVAYRGDKDFGIVMSQIKQALPTCHLVGFFDCDPQGFSMARASKCDSILAPSTDLATFKRLGQTDLFNRQYATLKDNGVFGNVYKLMIESQCGIVQEALIQHQIPLHLVPIRRP
ncbi:DUF7281 domain-containing protein [Vibrio breoganii]|uniref:DUF7281 domain-containing protein n=1 Tax=Vibrio breoganii TaxID=553239 RepID=UPI000C841921|nr:hypothetical protein [Vibrio breoganii]PML85185.1 hypothetical protein BCT68_07575 [Vibrio breoganii]